MHRTPAPRVLVPLAALAAVLIAPAAASAADCGIPGSPDATFTNTALDAQGDVPASKAGGFLQIPFNIPAGTKAIRVRYSYDQPGTAANPGGVCGGPSTNTLDMGVYEPKGAGDAFWPASASRGWSGSAVKDLAIAENGFTDETTYNAGRKNYVQGRTTRAYRPGAIPQGTWAVELGLAFIAADTADDNNGIHYHVKVETSTDAGVWANAPYSPSGYSSAPVRNQAGWYAGDLHVHGEQEPGNATMTQTFARAFDPPTSGGAGLDFVTLVDHNNNVAHDNLASYQAANPNSLIIPGTEMTTYRGHYNNEGKAPFVDFRNGPIYNQALNQVRAAVPPAETFSRIQANGNWTQINHPSIFRDLPSFCRGCAWSYDAAETDYSKVDAIEVQTGPAGIPSNAPVTAFNPFTPAAIEFYEDALATGAHIAAVGSSDDHQGGGATGPTDSPVGSATTMVFADELSEQGITDGVKGDHTYVKLFGNDGPDISLTATVPGQPPAIIGDSVSGKSVELTATVDGATRSSRTGAWKLVLLKDGEAIQSAPFSGDETSVTTPGSGGGRYSLEVVRSLGGVDYIEDYSSPIWFTKNSFGFGKTKRNKRKGTATLTVEVPGPGTVELAGKSIADESATLDAGGSTQLNVDPKGKLARKLAKRGKATVKAKVTYTPVGGDAATKAKKLKLRQKP